jgi:hypothetical protein
MAVRETSVSPRNALETSLAKIWSEVMDIESIGIHDNFFDLGGHSLMATRVITRMSRIFHIPFSIQILFEAPTIAKLSLVVLEQIIAQMDEEELEDILASDL